MENNIDSSASKSAMGVPVAIVVAGAVIAAALYFKPGEVVPQAPQAGNLAPGQPVAGQPIDPTQGQVAGAKVEIPVDDDDIVLGSVDAPVTLVEFTDIECPFCSRHHSQTYPQIKSEYIDTGKVRYVTKHFPLEQLHSRAIPGGIALQCANDQGKGMEYLDQLFANQKALSDVDLRNYAGGVGLDVGKFDSCVTGAEAAQAVTKDQQAGIAVGITGTPGFFINGQRLDGAQPFAQFQALIEAELNG